MLVLLFTLFQHSSNFPVGFPQLGTLPLISWPRWLRGQANSVFCKAVVTCRMQGLPNESNASVARPFVTLKIAVDQNGAVDDLDAVAKRFTSSESLDAVHRLRKYCGAVLVGVGTVIRDDPSLTVRRVPLHPVTRQPTRVVLDPSLRLLRQLPTAVVLTDGLDTLLLCSESAAAAARAAALTNGHDGSETLASNAAVAVAAVAGDGNGRLSVEAVLETAWRRGIGELMVEGGPATARGFLEARRVDRAGAARRGMFFIFAQAATRAERLGCVRVRLRQSIRAPFCTICTTIPLYFE